MEFKSIQNAIDLLESVNTSMPSQLAPGNSNAHRLDAFATRSQAGAIQLRDLPGHAEPKLEIPWGDFHQGVGSTLAALFTGPSASKDFLKVSPFKDSWVERRVPRRAVVAAALWHIAFLLASFSLLPGLPHKNPVFQNVELTWSGPIDDLPLLEIPREKPKVTARDAAPKAEPEQPLPGADAFHPRQRIFTDPVRPTHPQQTLINPAAPNVAPKLLPNMPNMVEFRQAAPARPRLQINEEMLKNLRPREKQATVTSSADAPNIEQRVADMSLPSVQNGPARPKPDLNAGSAPRVAQRAQAGDAGPAPEVGSTQLTSANGGANALIAISAAPAPPSPVPPPPGNVAAKVSISPDGKQPGNPNGSSNGTPAAKDAESPGGTSSKNSVGVSISGGNPYAKMSAPPARTLITREPKGVSEDIAERTGPPDFAALPPGAKPEVIFASKKMYTLNVNMANMNSATGSWILNFSELRTNADRPRMTTTDLSGPVPVKKVDPQYPQTLISERVQGEVLLYAVIQSDGSVDSIKLVRGIDEQLDANAMRALSQWKFRPASKGGEPVALEAIVHIPFRLPEFP